MILLAAAVLAPVGVVTAVASGMAVPVLVASAVAAALLASLLDLRVGFAVAILLATFVDYSSGRLALEMAVLTVWLAWTLLLALWSRAWQPWVAPSRSTTWGIAIWILVCGLGAAAGVLRGHSLKNVGVELAAALWPALIPGVMQVYRRRSLAWAGLALVCVALIHVVFGLTMLRLYERRIGGIFFMTTTGFVAVGLWAFALLAPRAKTRSLCLVGMIPMLAHLVLSFTRGYWLGALAGFTVATGLAWRSLGAFEPRLRFRRLLLLPALLGILLVTAGVSTLYFGSGEILSAVQSRFSTSFSTETSGETLSNVIRLLEYEQATGVALESPIFGQGLGYTFVTRDPITRALREQWYVHDYYLLIWLKLGIPGLLALAWLLRSLIRPALRSSREDPSWMVRAWGVAAVAVTIQLLVILVTNFSLADVNTAFVLAFIWGVFESARQDSPRAEGHPG